jgi:hypothetical protein
VETGFTREMTTNEEGLYLITAIPAGTYTITVRKTGFRTDARVGQIITQQLAYRADFKLEVGSVTQTVSVQATSPLLQTETASNAVTIDEAKITELPTIGHSYLQTAILSPGVVPTVASSILVVVVGQSQTGGAYLKPISVDVSGGAPDLTGFVQDGFDTREPLYGGSIYQPSAEAISSFRVVRGYDTAEYGGEPSIIYVTTKSGTNDYHGSIFEYNQNAGMEARAVPLAKVAPLTYNQGGFTFGGPALPQLRNKTFVFGSFQFSRMRSDNAVAGIVPTAAEWTGNMSSDTTQLYNPFNVNTTTGTRLPFSGNIIPTNLLSPFALNFEPLVPLPTSPSASYGQINLTMLGSELNDDTQYLIHVDQMLPHGGKLFAKYFRDHVNAVAYSLSRFAGTAQPLRGQTASLEWDEPIGGDKVSQLRLGFYRSVTDYGAVPTSQNYAGQVFGLKNLDSDPSLWGLPTVGVTGFSIPSSLVTSLHRVTSRLGASEDFALMAKRHAVNMGFLFEPWQQPSEDGNAVRGNITFGGSFTSQLPGGQGASALADFLLGTFTAANGNATGFNPVLNTIYWAWYVQDKYQISRRFTLTYGVRWDYLQPPTERHNRLVSFDQDTGQLVYVLANPLNFETNDTTLAAGVPRGLFKNFPKTDYSPRIGFAYLVTPNTTIRGGYGLYFSEGMSWFQLAPPAQGLPPFVNNTAVTNATNQLTPGTLVTQLFPAPVVNGLTPGTLAAFDDLHAPPSYVEQAAFSVEHQLGANMLVSVAYTGTFGHHLMAPYNVNQAALYNPNNPLTLAQRVPYPFFSDLLNRSDSGNSTYNGMSLRFEKHYSHGLDLIASYTWSKSLDMFSGSSSGFSNQNALCRRCDYGLSDFNHSQYFTLGYNWQLPFGSGRKWLSQGSEGKIIGNWHFSGITQFMTGVPLTASMPASWPNVAAAYSAARPNRICDGKLPHPTMAQFFSTSCFVAPPAYSFGNAGRNEIIGPGAQLWDMSLAREFRFAERFHLDFSGDFFSIFNHQNWGNPDVGVTDLIFGQITGKSNQRIIQLGLKLKF